MNLQTISDLIKQGKKPLVKITAQLWDESFGNKGMIARIISVRKPTKDDIYELCFDYNENAEHNIALDTPDWHLAGGGVGNAIQAGAMDKNNLTEEVFFDLESEIHVELVGEESLLAAYMKAQPGITYIEWLEREVEGLKQALRQTLAKP